MNDFDTMVAILGKVYNRDVRFDPDNMTIEVIDCENHSVLFLFDEDGNIHDWE